MPASRSLCWRRHWAPAMTTARQWPSVRHSYVPRLSSRGAERFEPDQALKRVYLSEIEFSFDISLRCG
jgi:hypothetical protein